MITTTVTLQTGIDLGDAGELSTLTLRAPTIDDGISAIESAGPNASWLRIKFHKLARCVVTGPALSRATIDEALAARHTTLLDALLALPESEAAALIDAFDATEKKPSASPSPFAPTAS